MCMIGARVLESQPIHPDDPMRKSRIANLLAIVTLLSTGSRWSAFGATLQVPSQYSQLQSAIDAAKDDDVILVAPGRYRGPFMVTKRLDLRGRSSVLLGAVSKSVFDAVLTYRSGGGGTLSGFVISGGETGIEVEDGAGALRIQDNSVSRNRSVTTGTGLLLRGNQEVWVERNLIQLCGQAIRAINANVHIVENRIYHCRAAFGGGISLGASVGEVLDNSLTGTWDGAITASSCPWLVIARNRLVACDAWDENPGIAIFSSSGVISKNLIRSSRIFHFGECAGIFVNGSPSDTVQVWNNVVHGCYRRVRQDAGLDSTAALNVYGATADVRNNIFYNNRGSVRWAEVARWAGPSTPAFHYNDLYGNTATDLVSGLVIDGTNLTSAPLFTDTSSYLLKSASPCRNAGDPDPAFEDLDGSRNDMGLHGGGRNLPAVISADIRATLSRYSVAGTHYLANRSAQNLVAGTPHSYYARGRAGDWREPDTLLPAQRTLPRDFGSYFNVNEASLWWISLGLDAFDRRYPASTAWTYVRRGLRTLRGLQTSGDAEKYHPSGTFYRSYWSTKGTRFSDRSGVEIKRDPNLDEQAADDNLLLCNNLYVIEGLAKLSPSLPTTQRAEVIDLCTQIRSAMNLRHFYQNGGIVVNFRNGVASAAEWDRLGAEGGIMAGALLLSGAITQAEFEDLSTHLAKPQSSWSTPDGTLTIDAATYHAAAFMPALYLIHGWPLDDRDSPGASVLQHILQPTLRLHLRYAQANGLRSLGSQAMSQTLDGYPVFEYWDGAAEGQGSKVQVQFPGNESLVMPDANHFTGPGALSRVSSPHANLLPFGCCLGQWDQGMISELAGWNQSLEGDAFLRDLGWTAVTPWLPGDSRIGWLDAKGKRNYSDWGNEVWELLNTAYLKIALHNALNPGNRIARFHAEAARIGHIEAFLFDGTPLPTGMF